MIRTVSVDKDGLRAISEVFQFLSLARIDCLLCFALQLCVSFAGSLVMGS